MQCLIDLLLGFFSENQRKGPNTMNSFCLVSSFDVAAKSVPWYQYFHNVPVTQNNVCCLYNEMYDLLSGYASSFWQRGPVIHRG